MDIYKIFFRNNSSPLPYKDITAFEGTLSNVFPSPQNAFCFRNLSHLVLEIFTFFKNHVQNLNTPQNNSVNWDLQMGFNLAFTRLNGHRHKTADASGCAVLRCRSAAACLVGLWVQILPRAWMFVCCECCVLSDRGLCNELITRPEESY